MRPPLVKCLTRTVHPGIADNGEVELSPLNWHPYREVSDIFHYLRSLMNNPNQFVIDCPMNHKVAILFSLHPQEWQKQAASFTERYAKS